MKKARERRAVGKRASSASDASLALLGECTGRWITRRALVGRSLQANSRFRTASTDRESLFDAKTLSPHVSTCQDLPEECPLGLLNQVFY